MSTPRSASFRGFFREAIAIFMGVVVALAADDWRQSRVERAEAEASLRLILQDLASDTAQLAEASLEFASHDAMAVWLYDRWEGPEPDSTELVRNLSRFWSMGIPQISRAGYEGLRASNQLDLLRGDSLQTRLVRYYETLVPDMTTYWETVYARREALLDAFAPHVRFPTYGGAGGSTPVLREGWPEMTSDARLQDQLRRFGLSAGYAARLAEGDLRVARRHMESISDFLDGRGGL